MPGNRELLEQQLKEYLSQHPIDLKKGNNLKDIIPVVYRFNCSICDVILVSLGSHILQEGNMKEFKLEYWNDRKQKTFTRHFKTFKEAYDHAIKNGLHAFHIDGVLYLNID